MMDFCDLEKFNLLVACLHRFDYNTNELLITSKKADFSISVSIQQKDERML